MTPAASTPQGDREALAEVAALVARRAGIEIGESRMPWLAGAVDRVCPGEGPAAFLAAVRAGGRGRALFARLIDEVTVKETYFFREPGTLIGLDWRALLSRARERGDDKVRVWVAACATGEEPYLLGMLASESFRPMRPPVTILATDISQRALDHAGGAAYGARSVRGLPRDLRAAYLAERDGRHVVAEPVRRLVTFRTHNLAVDPFPPAGEVGFDLIACRNVLIYMRADIVQRVVDGIAAALRPGGVLVLGSADRLAVSAVRAARPAAGGSSARERPARPPPPRPATENRLDASAHYRRGLAALDTEDWGAAIAAFRRALYLDPGYALAAFQLARSHESVGDERSARRTYEQAVRTIARPGAARDHGDDVNLEEVAAACRSRIAELG